MKEITFSDVLIEPQYSEIFSRSSVDISSDMGKVKLSLPVISANMKHITGPKMALSMHRNGGIAILHRFNSIKEGIEEFLQALQLIKNDSERKENTNEAKISFSVGVSIGVHEIDKKRFNDLFEKGARLFCIDIAHGHHLYMKNMLHWIRNNSADKNRQCVVIAGNVATAKAALDIYNWGADIIKVGIGPGAVCQTRQNTGVGVPQLYAIKNIRQQAKKQNIDLKIISDGGIKQPGDIAKALKYANAVMVGSFIAGTSETPGDVYENPKGEFYKVYGGSASAENKVSSGKENKFVEGMMKTVPFRGHVKYILRKIHENVQSAFSYVGANNLKEFQQKAILREITYGGKMESKI